MPDEITKPGPDFDAVIRLYKELDKESDRGTILVAGAMLEEGLGELLIAHLAPNPTSSDPLFDGPNAPLQSFSARIDATYRLGLISDRFCRDLHVIRRIRNDVAHRAASGRAASCIALQRLCCDPPLNENVGRQDSGTTHASQRCCLSYLGEMGVREVR